MGDNKDSKRKKDKQSDDEDYRREKKSKRKRSRSRSPEETRERDSRRKRRHSTSKSPERNNKQERRREEPLKETDVKTEAPVKKNKEIDMLLNTRTGGAYIPPARLRMMQAQITDKTSIAYQRLAWEALKKSIHGHINKINVGNIGVITKQLLKENIVRGRGLLCRSVIQAQAASPTFTNVYAALVAAVNSRFPNIGELLLKRLVIQFKRGFKRNDKPICISSASFIAHLVNQRVAHEILALELLTLLVESPTDDSIEVAIAFLKECGQKLTEVSSKGVNAIFEMLRNILHEGQLDKRVQYMIEVMFQVWKDGFKDHPALIEELELVPEEEQFTHLLMLDEATDPQDILNVFKFDEKYEENEQKYQTLCKEILGSDAESDGEEGSGESGSEESDEEEGEDGEQKPMTIIDNTETNLVALRRTIYLTINSSLDFEECAHKLMKMQLKPGQEVELCHMFLDCCAEQRTYEKFYGLLAQRFCNINRIYIGPFEEIFRDSYSTAHRLDTNRLRNVSKFFAHLLFTDSIGWEVLQCVKLNEEDTTSSSRIYIKILFQELAEYMGLKKLNDRLKDPTLQDAFQGIFPRDNPKNTRFSINFFTSIGLGGLTDELREHLKQMPKNVPPPITEIKLDSDSSSDDSSSSSSSDDSSSSSSDSSSSDSEEETGEKNKINKNKKSKENKSKDKTPKTPDENPPPEENERWGHDGFYDTYGKDARRTESRPDRGKDNFVRPYDVRRNDDSRRGRDFDQRSGDPRRDDRRRDDRNRQDNDDRRNREDRRDRDGERDGRNGDRDNSNGERDNSRNRRDDDDRRRDRNEEDGSRSEESRSKRDVDPRSRRDEDIRSRREEENRSRKEENYRPSREEDSRQRREEDSRTRREDSKTKREEDSRSKREEDLRTRREDDSRSGREEDSRTRREDDSRRQRDARHRKEESSKSDEDTRFRREDGTPRREDDYSKSRRDDQREADNRSGKDEIRSKRAEDFRSRKEEENSRSRKDDEVRSKRYEETKSKREDTRTTFEYSKSSREELRSRREDEISSKQEADARSKKEPRSRRDEDSSDKEEYDTSNRKKKDKNKKKKNKSDSNDDSSEEDSKSRRQDKENRKKKKRDKKNKESEASSEEESRSKKREKERKKVSRDEWDIPRASSLRREVEVGRYWDN